MQSRQSRRRLLATLSSAAGVSLIGSPNVFAQQAPPETTRIRLSKSAAICVAPQYVADDLLRAEGFTDIRYVARRPGFWRTVTRARRGGFGALLAAIIVAIDAGEPLTIVAGVHVGCFELFAHEGIRSIRDLKGRKVGVQGVGSGPTHVSEHYGRLCRARPGQGYRLGQECLPQADGAFRRAQDRRISRNPAGAAGPARPQDRPCDRQQFARSAVVAVFLLHADGQRDFVRKNPVATKRVLRAIIKAADLCVTDPIRVAQRMVDGGFTARYDYALQTLNEIPYNKWREYDPEDTIRFYSLRLREAGMIKSSPTRSSRMARIGVSGTSSNAS